MYNYNNYLSNDYFRNTTPSMENSNSSLYTPTEWYNKGNLFADLYEEYKNYKPVTLVAGNEQQKLFLELSKMAFAAHELNLYLDLNPDDETMLSLFNDYRTRVNNLMMEYEKKYGPLTIASDSLSSSFLWEKQDWPWEGGNV